jgi:hypothetical protein
MDRNIIDLRPDCDIILDAEELIATYSTHDEIADEWIVCILLKSRSKNLYLHCKTRDKADKCLQKIAERMIK